MPKKTATNERLKYLEETSMSDGMRPELKALVEKEIEPAIKERVLTKNALSLSSAYQRESMAPVFDQVRMPFKWNGYESIGLLLRNESVSSVLDYLQQIKREQDKRNNLENEYAYLCDCIDLMQYINRLISIGIETQYPVSYGTVYCRCCFRFAESEEVGGKKNISLCRECREVAADGQDYKKANKLIDNYIDITNKGRSIQINKHFIWAHLKQRQDKEQKEGEQSEKVSLIRELASEYGLSSKDRYAAVSTLINLLPRLNAKLSTIVSSTNTLNELMVELLKHMEYSYIGIKDYFQANPSYFCGTLMRYDCYLLLNETVDLHKQQIKKAQLIRDMKIEDYVAQGMKKTEIAKKLGMSRSNLYKIITRLNSTAKNSKS